MVLRPLSRNDVPALRALAAGPRGTFEWAFVPTPDQVLQYVDGALALMERKAALVFAICTPDGELAGCTRLFDLQRWEWLTGKDPRQEQDVLDAGERMARGRAPPAGEAAAAMSAHSSSLCCSSLARSRSPSVPKPFPGGIFLFIWRWYSR